MWLSHFLLFPETGFGALQRSRNLLKELSKYNDIYYLSYVRNADLSEGIDLNEAVRDLNQYCKGTVLISHPHNKNFVLKYTALAKSIVSIKPYSILMYQFNAFYKKILDILTEQSIDLIYSDTMGLIEPVLDKIKVPCVINHHNIESCMMFRRAEKAKNLFVKMFYFYEACKIKNYEKKFCHQHNKNIVVSELDKKNLMAINLLADVEVVENGVDCNYFKFNPREKLSKNLIFTGGLDWYPNLDAMIYFCEKVWPLLVKKIPDVTLTIIGKNSGSKIDNIAKKYSNIILTGYVPDVRKYMKEASVFICPIRDGGGTKLKILDAMAQGVPIVTTSLGCEGILVTDGEHLCIADEPKKFVEKICGMINNTDEQNRLAMNAYDLIKNKYSYHIIGSKFNNILSNCK